MSDNLSFTQELRQLGLIADANAINNTKTEKVIDTNDNTESTIEKGNISEEQTEEKKFTFNDSKIFVGKKPAMNYVLAIKSRMSEGLDKVTIKSRGKTISKAVDVAEIVTNRFITDANDDEVRLSTEEIFREDGTSTNVSTIEIVIKRD